MLLAVLMVAGMPGEEDPELGTGVTLV